MILNKDILTDHGTTWYTARAKCKNCTEDRTIRPPLCKVAKYVTNIVAMLNFRFIKNVTK